MGLLDKVKAGAEQAAAKAKEGVQELELKRELGQLHSQLGAKTFELVEKGEIANPMLDELVGKVRAVKEKLAAVGEPQAAEKPASESPSSPVT